MNDPRRSILRNNPEGKHVPETPLVYLPGNGSALGASIQLQDHIGACDLLGGTLGLVVRVDFEQDWSIKSETLGEIYAQ